MVPTGNAIIEVDPGVYLTLECSGERWGRSEKIEKAHIMSLEYAKEEVRRRNSYIDGRTARMIELYVPL